MSGNPLAARYFAEHAWLPGGLAADVVIEIADRRFVAVTAGGSPEGAQVLPGVVFPGFANAHSHAFHRALRGRTHDGGGTFWTWRQRMYAVAGRLDPDSYLALARATYAEMALAGVTAVGEFHYLHHAPGGRRYDDPNAMAEALRQAAFDAGIRLTLLDACYLSGGLAASGHGPLDEVQQGFSDGDAQAWYDRVAQLKPSAGMQVGYAVHSVRAVPKADLATVRQAAHDRGPDTPLHVHLSEQPAENEACLAFYGQTPTELLSGAGLLGPTTSAVHATHLSENDISLLGATRTTACFCPTTEQDLADGIGPSLALRRAGAPLSLGSDQHAVIDLLTEARALEAHERLVSLRRGNFTPAELTAALTAHSSIGWPDAGRIEIGGRADLVAVRRDTVRTAGCQPEQLVMAATAADVDTVVVDGEVVVEAGRHRLGDVAALLSDAIAPLWKEV